MMTEEQRKYYLDARAAAEEESGRRVYAVTPPESHEDGLCCTFWDVTGSYPVPIAYGLANFYARLQIS